MRLRSPFGCDVTARLAAASFLYAALVGSPATGIADEPTAETPASALSPVKFVQAKPTTAVTCCQPPVSTISVRTVSSIRTGNAEDTLAKWAAGSQERAPLTATEIDRIRLGHSSPLPRHAIDLIAQLSGPLSESDLAAACEWEVIPQVSAEAGERVVLKGCPHDEMARLFLREIRVECDDTDGQPRRISVLMKEERTCSVDLKPTRFSHEIVQVSYGTRLHDTAASSLPPLRLTTGLREDLPPSPRR